MSNEKCPCCIDKMKDGGPGWGTNTCPECGKKEKRYYMGSWDWEPKICIECEIKKVKDADKDRNGE